MNNCIKKFLLFIFILFIFTKNNVTAQISSEIILKINDEIITNIDLENEKKYLLFLNPNLVNLSSSQINKISKDSLTNRKIKEIELSKYFNLKQDKLGEAYIKNFTKNSNYKNINNLKNELIKFNLNYNHFENNLLIDNVWREFIFNKYKSTIQIDIEKLRKQIEKKDFAVEELNLSEILFKNETNESFDILKNKIYNEIQKSGFEATASIFSISETKNFGGKLGWIKSNQISEKIYSEIKKTSEITDPIFTGNGYLILKINERRTINQEVNIKEELNKLVNLETEKELNKLGYIYFNKIKKRIFINEN
tara:strand:- start:17 stop:943 length:927 start_codon:yes stop_codon:yes gene_type:complete